MSVSPPLFHFSRSNSIKYSFVNGFAWAIPVVFTLPLHQIDIFCMWCHHVVDLYWMYYIAGYLKQRHVLNMRMVYVNTNCLGSVVNTFLCFTKTFIVPSKFLMMKTSKEKTLITVTVLWSICFISWSSHFSSMRQVLLPTPGHRWKKWRFWEFA